MATKRRKKKKGLYIFSLAFLFLMAAAMAGMAMYRYRELNGKVQEKGKSESKGPTVNVTKVLLTAASENLSLIGEARPVTESTIYAKLSGYLRDIYVDKGDHVKKGQVLAKIESPETDQGYIGARADAANKVRISQRMKVLEGSRLISAQEAEQAYAAADIAKAQLRTQKVLKGYEILKAPFDGIITARYADPGDLIQNGASSQAVSLAIVTISQTEKLRIYVYVDQKDATAIKVGQPAKLHVAERPDRIFYGRVRRLSDELDPRTRMLLTEVDYDNSNHDFMAGSFVIVELTVTTPQMLKVPVGALVFRGEKSYLAIAGNDSRVHLQPVTIIDDDGITASLVGNIAPGTQVILALGPNINNNARIQISDPTSKNQPGEDQPQQVKNQDEDQVQEGAEQVSMAKGKKRK